MTQILAVTFFYQRRVRFSFFLLFSLIGALAVIIGLYAVLWGKAKDLEEIKNEMHPQLQNDQSPVQLLIDESPEKKNCKADLEAPLLSSQIKGC